MPLDVQAKSLTNRLVPVLWACHSHESGSGLVRLVTGTKGALAQGSFRGDSASQLLLLVTPSQFPIALPQALSPAA